MWSWKVQIQPSDEQSFEYKATFALSKKGLREGIAEGPVLAPRYLYGQGDLAVFLEDLGAGAPAIGTLIQELNDRPSAEIVVEIAEEAMEILWPGLSRPF